MVQELSQQYSCKVLSVQPTWQLQGQFFSILSTFHGAKYSSCFKLKSGFLYLREDWFSFQLLVTKGRVQTFFPHNTSSPIGMASFIFSMINSPSSVFKCFFWDVLLSLYYPGEPTPANLLKCDFQTSYCLPPAFALTSPDLGAMLGWRLTLAASVHCWLTAHSSESPSIFRAHAVAKSDLLPIFMQLCSGDPRVKPFADKLHLLRPDPTL